MNIIHRQLYTDRIKPFFGKNLIKVLTGQRRVGKSCIMQDLSRTIQTEDSDSNIIFIDKEKSEFREIRNEIDLENFINSKIQSEKKNYLFIDEVQDIENFEVALRSILSEEKCDIFVTGSNAYMLSSDLSTYLSGRYIEFHIQSLTYREFMIFHNLTDSDETLLNFLKFGGLPQISKLTLDEEIAFEYLKNVFSTILLKDVVSREKIRDITFLENLSFFLAQNVGSIFSANKISEYLKFQKIEMSRNIVINYLKFLCSAFIVNKTQRFDIQGKKIFATNEKYYFEDLGLRNAICGFNFSSDIGKLIENAVYLHLKSLNFQIFVGKQNEYEIDFVAKKHDCIIYVQVAYILNLESTEIREFGNLLKINDNYPKYLVSMNPLLTESNYNGIRHIHLRKFLQMTEL